MSMDSQTGRPRRRLGIATQVLIGLGLGVLVGLFFGEAVAFLQLGGDIFIALLQVTVIPYVVVALIRVKNKERFVDLLSTVGDTLMTMTAFIGRLAPYGVFAITAAAAGTIDIGDLARLQVYIVTYVSMALILSLWIIPGLIATREPRWSIARNVLGWLD
jgi:Na+/H+-dicarboxylate symporter